jgi:tetratricopeptide (TPR) repeat protein
VFLDDASVLFAHRGKAARVVAKHELTALAPFQDPGRGFAGVVRGGNREAACTELQAMIALWPGAGLARQWLAQARLEEGKAQEALAILERIPARAFTGATAFQRGQTLLALGRPHEAIQAFRGALDHPRGPEPPAVHRAIALTRHSFGDHARAYAAFKRAIRVMDEPSAEDLFRYAASAIGTGRIEEGVQLLRVAELRLKPGEEALRARILSALAAAGSAPIEAGPPVQSTPKSPYLSTQ